MFLCLRMRNVSRGCAAGGMAGAGRSGGSIWSAVWEPVFAWEVLGAGVAERRLRFVFGAFSASAPSASDALGLFRFCASRPALRLSWRAVFCFLFQTVWVSSCAGIATIICSPSDLSSFAHRFLDTFRSLHISPMRFSKVRSLNFLMARSLVSSNTLRLMGPFSCSFLAMLRSSQHIVLISSSMESELGGCDSSPFSVERVFTRGGVDAVASVVEGID